MSLRIFKSFIIHIVCLARHLFPDPSEYLAELGILDGKALHGTCWFLLE
jgi:hypothetical protein